MESIHLFLKSFQLRWAGHVLRMPDERLLKRLLFGELVEGKSSLRVQKERYKDTLKASLKHCNIDSDTWEEIARDRTFRRNTGVSSFETRRVEEQEQKRQRRKIRMSTASSTSAYPCPHCSRQFSAKIGLTSHLRTHRSKE